MSGDAFARDVAVTALVLSMAAFAWFGWGQEDPPARWRAPMAVGSALSGGMALASGYLTWRLWDAGSILADQPTRRLFGIVCGIEIGFCLLGAVLLAVTRHSRHLAPWILFVVGVHVVPLAPILRDHSFYALACLATGAAVFSGFWAHRRRVAPSAVTGIAGGGVFVLVAMRAGLLAIG